VVGHAVASDAGDDAELQRIAVDPAYRRRGLASDLLAAVEARAAADGATRLLLEVREDNATAAAFYEAQGFEEVGRRPGYYRDGATPVVLGQTVGHRGGTAGSDD
jgi:ribosomal-protein-alanine N-acetyltransferase